MTAPSPTILGISAGQRATFHGLALRGEAPEELVKAPQDRAMLRLRQPAHCKGSGVPLKRPQRPRAPRLCRRLTLSRDGASDCALGCPAPDASISRRATTRCAGRTRRAGCPLPSRRGRPIPQHLVHRLARADLLDMRPEGGALDLERVPDVDPGSGRNGSAQPDLADCPIGTTARR
jgi:hypothetical protein